ncbi:hypothetical protein ACROYT_G000121 [Oculina patagonica]
MFIEASTPRLTGDIAKLEFAVSSSDIGKLSCLEFYYHMYGDTIDTLNVYNGNTTIFTKNGNQGNVWLNAKFTVNLQSKITFEGICGDSYTGDIAIDDVYIVDGSFQVFLDTNVLEFAQNQGKFIQVLNCFLLPFLEFSTTLNKTFGQIELTATNNDDDLYIWKIQNAGIREAVAFISVQKLNFPSCSEYAKIIDGNGTEVLDHFGCASFAPEILADVAFGLSSNISIQVNTDRLDSSIKIKFAILKNGLTSALPVLGWNVTIFNLTSTSFTLQWTKLNTVVNQSAKVYLVEVKSIQGIILAVETVPENTTTTVIKGLSPSTKYRVGVFGVDNIGQPYKSLESVPTTNKAFCGSRPSMSRIVGGTEAPVNSWPWQVMVTDNYGNQFCGGSLVDPYWVVTAAHCMVGETPSSVKIRLAAHYRTDGSVGTEQDIGVAQIIMHESYKTPLKESNDIALIKLADPADLGESVGLVCLPDTGHHLPFDNVNKKCSITGWGRLSSGGSQPNTLQQASVPLVSKQRCTNAYPDKIDNSMLCAGFDEGGVDACQGDSGGPLVCEFNGTWYLEGVSSWGYGCAHANKYGVYANVRNFKHWLSTNMYKVAPSVTPQNQSSSFVWCNFEHGLCSGWNQSSSDDFDWTLASGGTPSSSTGPTSGQGGSGKYMYIEASSPRKPGENAKLVVTVPNNGNPSCLSFYYHMYGASAGTLNVYSGNTKVFAVSGNQENNWLFAEKTFYLKGVVTFEGITGRSYTGDIAIDSVQITEGNCTGKYMYIEASGRSPGDNAKLQLEVTGGRSATCLMFYYHMYGSDMGTLNVFSGNTTIFSRTGDEEDYWKEVTMTIKLSDVLTFEGIVGLSYNSDIAIDNVTVSEGDCPVSKSCDFDSGLCDGWQQSFSDVFDWTWHTGSTLSSNTGPDYDHTSGSGYYMFIETSYPRFTGDNAKLVIPVSVNEELSCLTFYYHMYGDTMGTLTVFSGDMIVFNTSGNHGNKWIKAEITIHLNYTVTFEGIVGSGNTADLAIDDVSISNGSCQSHTATPTFSTASTFAPSLSSMRAPSIEEWSLSSGQLTLNPYTTKPLLSSDASSLNPSTSYPSLPSSASSFNPSIMIPSLSSRVSTLNSSPGNPSLSSTTWLLNPSTLNPSLSSGPLVFKSSSAEDSMYTGRSSFEPATAQPSSSSMPSFKPSFSVSLSTPKASLPTSESLPATTKTVKQDSSRSTPTPKIPSLKKAQTSAVLLEVRDLDINKWNKGMESDFKTKVATVATDYCVVEGHRCQVAPKGSRRKRSSNNMVFTSDMVHILPGYPKQSPDNPAITLLAFYLQLPQDFSDNIVDKHVLIDIVKSDVSSIEGSIGGTISSVQPLFTTTDSTEESDGESKPMSAIIGACVGGVLFLVIVIALLLACKRSNSDRRAKESPASSYNGNAYFNNAYYIGSGEQAIEMSFGNRHSSGKVPDGKPEEHYYAEINNPSSQSAATLKFPQA